MTEQKPKPSFGIEILKLFVLIVILAGAYAGAQYWADQESLVLGTEAVDAGNCEEATRHFSNLVNEQRLLLYQEYTTPARAVIKECMAYQQAASMEEESEFSAAILAYADFIRQYDESSLASRARRKLHSIFREADPTIYATNSICRNLDVYLSTGQVSTRAAYLPTLYVACGEYYDSMNSPDTSLDYYYRVLTEFSGTKDTHRVAELLLQHDVACEYIDGILEEYEHTGISKYIPEMLVKCGQHFQEQSLWLDAIALYDWFLRDYPKHALRDAATDGLVISSVARAKQNINEDGDGMRPSGYSGTDQAVIVIQSNTPEKLRIFFSGLVNQIVEVPPCSDCEVFDTPPKYCPPSGETIKVTIEPGSYEVAIDSLENPGSPNWMGVWDLASGKKYFSCFYQYSASSIS